MEANESQHEEEAAGKPGRWLVVSLSMQVYKDILVHDTKQQAQLLNDIIGFKGFYFLIFLHWFNFNLFKGLAWDIFDSVH